MLHDTFGTFKGDIYVRLDKLQKFEQKVAMKTKKCLTKLEIVYLQCNFNQFYLHLFSYRYYVC
jgi:hypothetical protein